MYDKRKKILQLIKEIAVKEPNNSIPVPEGLKGFGFIEWSAFKCSFCNKCVEICPEDALTSEKILDLPKVYAAPDSVNNARALNRALLWSFIKKLAVKAPVDTVKVPDELEGFGRIIFHPENCTACNKCVEICPEDALKLLPMFNLPEIFKKIKISEER